jgi:hypothetical protein
VDPEVVLVEHSEDEAQERAAAACEPEKLLVRPNRGYAAGLNTGTAEADGDALFLANPDIEFLDGSVGALIQTLADGADVAGPQLLWDRHGEVVLPIPDDPRPAAELWRTVRRRWPGRRSIEHLLDTSWRVWTATRPCDVASLRGPLLALNADTALRLGPLDEGYFLFYEETEWLWRARRRGARLAVAPRSRVVHRWGHATNRRDDSAIIEERSRMRFFERNYSWMIRALLRRLAPAGEPVESGFERIGDPAAIPPVESDVWLVSNVFHMQPSVGCLGVPALPPSALELTASGRWYAVAARRDGDRWRLSGSWMWERT